MSKAISRFRAAAFLRQQGLCCYCRLPMWLSDPTPFVRQFGLTIAQAALLQCTAEHRISRSEGGRDSAENISAACRFCNRRRHCGRTRARTAEAFREHVERRMKVQLWHGFEFPTTRSLASHECLAETSTTSE
jgi:5-methylcytosine-specific restriction endonuclease McrA